MLRLLSKFFIALSFLTVTSLHSLAEWSIVTYIQADNNLESFAYHNIKAMQKVATSSDVNILVQWDQPRNRKTWRYKVEKNKLIDAGTLNTEMGVNPEKELVDMMQWVKNNYPAKKYMMVLWNHGNGVLDRNKKAISSWIEIPGAVNAASSVTNNNANSATSDDRGILYDDSQGTFLTNGALKNALNKIHTQVLGKKLDIIGMDACLMAMVEVAYQMKDHVHYFVGAEHTEPGDGWAYDGFLAPLVANPQSFTSARLATSVVNAYKNYYTWDRECTQSAINLTRINTLKNGVNKIISRINKLKRKRNKQITNLINRVSNDVIRFYTSSYVDLHSFYNSLLSKTRSLRKKKKRSNTKALRKFETLLKKEMSNLRKAVIANAVGRDFSQAKGISIYWPRKSVDTTYLNTDFAKDSLWVNFIKQH